MQHGVRHWRIGEHIDAFDIVSGPEKGFLHCHATFNVGAMIDGRAHVAVGDIAHDQLPGAVVTLNAYQPHASAWFAATNTYFVLHINEAFWDEGSQISRLAWRFLHPVSQDKLVFHFLCGLRAELETSPEAVRPEEIQSLMQLCQTRGLMEQLPVREPDVDEAAIKDLLRLGDIEGTDLGGMAIDSVAQEAGLSRFQFAKLCQRTSGMQPRRLRIQLMVARAQRSIQQGLDLAAASAMAGFSDQSHMSREFRRTIGMTPREYQRLNG